MYFRNDWRGLPIFIKQQDKDNRIKITGQETTGQETTGQEITGQVTTGQVTTGHGDNRFHIV